MVNIKYDLDDKRVRFLVSTDETLGKLIKYIGSSEVRIEKDGFKCLVKYIVGQQISDKARQTIWRRICETLCSITPNTILKVSNSTLREIGLSRKKIEYIKILARSVIEKAIDFELFQTVPNEKIISQLTTIKGIGKWTAEMYLIFSLGRENVLSKGDGTIRRTIQWMYNYNTLPSTQMLVNKFSKWEEYATIVCSYLWKAAELELTKYPFDEIIMN